MPDETTAWLRYARENLTSSEVLLERSLLNPCLQNAQQAVEKALKAALLRQGERFGRPIAFRRLPSG
ncbi:MAG: hypothetical protein AUJ96_14670 [Armatimonadetes bacterium CG2_30_66_41]|nr:MAG: hypothetical protein AUJ96_14670 [Armatimonadetes bacterium CG2_30_66_41]